MQHATRRPGKLWLAAASAIGVSLLAASPASALITCNSNGDCWQTETRITYPGVTLNYHDEAWRDAHREDKAYRWHETDNDHDWHHGYWEKGEWHHMD
jgi:hypothetical protein